MAIMHRQELLVVGLWWVLIRHLGTLQEMGQMEELDDTKFDRYPYVWQLWFLLVLLRIIEMAFRWHIVRLCATCLCFKLLRTVCSLDWISHLIQYFIDLGREAEVLWYSLISTISALFNMFCVSCVEVSCKFVLKEIFALFPVLKPLDLYFCYILRVRKFWKPQCSVGSLQLVSM